MNCIFKTKDYGLMMMFVKLFNHDVMEYGSVDLQMLEIMYGIDIPESFTNALYGYTKPITMRAVEERKLINE